MEQGARERESDLTCTRGKSNTCARYIWAWRNGMAPVHSRFQSHSFSYVSKNNDDSGNENGRLLCRPAIRQQYEQNAGEALGQRKLWPLDREHVYEVCKKFRRCWDFFTIKINREKSHRVDNALSEVAIAWVSTRSEPVHRRQRTSPSHKKIVPYA